PNSKFSLMAEKTLRECKKNLAEHEFYVGYFYFKKKQYKSAMKRFEIIAKDYSNLGLDYKLAYFLGETKKRLALEEASKLESKSTK
ncbi:MAG: outer membrane protein assembly factor BamD, partial [Syntrophales bacterium]